ncbi:MAG: glycoside hydrolase family 27 protein [Verrucomicrobiota bacterium]
MVLHLAALLTASVAAQTSNQAAGRPPMGWNSWNWFGKQEINEGIVEGVIDAMATSGLKEAGYEYVVVDGGWRNKDLGPDNELLADPGKFPHGIKALADHAHARGLKLGLHTVPGTHDCGGDKVGGYGHEQTHVRQFVDWGVDFIKLDQCLLQTASGWNEKLTQEVYTNWQRLLGERGRDIVLSISAYRFRDWYPPVCRMARTTPDISCRKYRGANFDSTPQGVMPIALLNDKSAAAAGKGYWNDPDILVIGEQGLNAEEQTTHFALWCIMTAPLILGNDPRHMLPDEKAILLNRECIAVDQDPTEQGRRLKVVGDIEIWVKHLAGGRMAALLVNRHATASKPASVTRQDLGLSGALRVRDIYQNKDVGALGDSFHGEITPHGCAFLLFAPDSVGK